MTSILKIFCLLPLLCCFSDITIAQYSPADSLLADSLKKVSQVQKEDTVKVNILNRLSALLGRNREAAMAYAREAILLSKKINFENGQGRAYYNYAIALAGANYYGERGIFNEVFPRLDSALQIFKSTGNELETANCYWALADIYATMQENFPESLKYALAAVAIYERLGNKKKLAACYTELSDAYFDGGEKQKGQAMLENALKVYEELNDSGHVAYINNAIGTRLLYENKYKDALKHFEYALTTYKALGIRSPDYGIAWTQGNIADVYMAQGDSAVSAGNRIIAQGLLTKALGMFKVRLEVETAGNMSHRDCYIELGDCNFLLAKISAGNDKLHYLSESKKYLELALQLAKETDSKALFMKTYARLAELNNQSGDFKDAYNNYMAYIVYRDSLSNEESETKNVQLKMQYEFDKKDAAARANQEKKDAEGKRERNFHYTVIVFFLALAVFLFWNNRQKQQSKSKIEKAYAELKSTQAQLIQSEKMASLGELTAGIAHEIQNPLNFVNNFSEVSNELVDEMNEELNKGDIEEAKVIAGDIKQNLEKINHHGKRADAIVKGMLQHSRSSSSATKEPTDINKLADEYLRLAYHGLRAKDKAFNATLKTGFDETIGKVSMIPQDIGRVMLNLFTNAFYATGERKKAEGAGYEPTVSISIKKQGDKIEIRVTDNGSGIPQNIVDKVFQPFFTTKPTGQGTGLGLSLAYDIVKAHGGELRVETGEGEGTTFTVQLPV